MAIAKCDDCNQFAEIEDLEPREPWNGGYRHKHGTGCWPKENKERDNYTVTVSRISIIWAEYTTINGQTIRTKERPAWARTGDTGTLNGQTFIPDRKTRRKMVQRKKTAATVGEMHREQHS